MILPHGPFGFTIKNDGTATYDIETALEAMPQASAATPSNLTVPIILTDGVELALNVSDPISIPAGTHKVLILGSFLAVLLGSGTGFAAALRRGTNVNGTLIMEFAQVFAGFTIGDQLALSPIAVDLVTGPISALQYTLTGLVRGSSGEAIANSIAVLVLN